MIKIVKWLVVSTVSFTLILLIATVSLVNFVDPNQFKEPIENLAFKQTGYRLTLKGPLSWRAFPLLSLQLDNVLLQDGSPSRAPVGTAKTIKAECSLRSLYSANLHVILTLQDVALMHDSNEPLKIESIQATVLVHDGIIQMNPFVLHIANSRHTGNLSVNLRGKTPAYSLTHSADNFNINPLLTRLGYKDRLEGLTHLKMALRASGNSPSELKHSLSGTLSVEIINGKLYGLDLPLLLKNVQAKVYNLANALLQRSSTPSTTDADGANWKPTSSLSTYTPFSALKGTATIVNGLLKNPDFSVTHPEYTIQGSGTFSLTHQVIQYQASMRLLSNPYPANDKIGQFLAETPISLSVQGNLSAPSIRPDLNTYTNAAIAYAKKEGIKTVIEKGVHKALDHLLNKLNKE